MKSKVLSAVLTAALLLCQVFAVPIFAEEPVNDISEDSIWEENGFKFIVSGGEALLDCVTEAASEYDSDSGLTKIVIPETLAGFPVTTIRFGAFSEFANEYDNYDNYESTPLSVTLPSTVKTVCEGAFTSCYVKEIHITELEAYCNIDFFDPYDSEDLSWAKSYDMFFRLGYPDFRRHTYHYNTPYYSAPVGRNIYLNGELIESLVIPDGVKSISSSAFAESSIKSVTIPESVTEIGSFAFEGSSLEKVTFSEDSKLKKIGYGAFAYSALTEIDIPAGVTSIYSAAFEGCQSLEGIEIPNKLEHLGFAFYDTAYYKNPDNYEDSFLYIGDALISYDAEDLQPPPSALTEDEATVLSSEEPNTASTYSDSDTSDSETVLKIKDGTYIIGGYAFGFVEAADINTITIPDSVEILCGEAFCGCYEVENINLSKNLRIIESEAFYYCHSLKELTVPDSVTSIGAGAFSHCSSLENIILPKELKSIEEYTFEYCSNLTKIDIPNSVAAIGESAFSHCEALEKVVWHNSLQKIGDSAFEACSALKELTIPDGDTSEAAEDFYDIKSIESNVFFNCPNLETIHIPDGIEHIGARVFYYSSKLKEVSFPQKLKSIGEYAFNCCNALKAIDLPQGINSIGEYAFYECTAIEKITLPGSLGSGIGKGAFYGCSNLLEITLEDGITVIPDSCFYLCSSVAIITLTHSVEDVNKYAFTLNSDKFRYIRYVGTEEEYKEIDFLEKSLSEKVIYVCECGSFDNCKLIPECDEDGNHYYNYYCKECDKVLWSGSIHDSWGVELLRCDLNSDGALDSLDLAVFNKKFMSGISADEYDLYINYDINENGYIDVLDFVRLKKNIAYMSSLPVN